jgi:hypothetical protein
MSDLLWVLAAPAKEKELARSRPELSGVQFSLDPAARMGRPAAARSFLDTSSIRMHVKHLFAAYKHRAVFSSLERTSVSYLTIPTGLIAIT